MFANNENHSVKVSYMSLTDPKSGALFKEAVKKLYQKPAIGNNFNDIKMYLVGIRTNFATEDKSKCHK